MSLGVVLAFSALLLLALVAVLWSRWPAWLKGLLVIGVTALYFVGHDVVREIAGLPSTDALPERFIMIGAVVEEPTAKTKGALYLWVSRLQEGKPAGEPRAYKVPYTRELHRQIDDGVRKGRDGVAQMGNAEPKTSGSGRGLGFLRPGNDEQEIKIRDLPSPQLPEK